ncbi:GAF domain-containing protein (plasmid) [Paracoccus liaowanqingii]|uniref:GAF domain-containing protein n=2 Tax=Paracoccus liaowanqingii TaxID=2560053 RepID=A0A4Y5SSY5_9RHOB|nr:GAF domain-containing protein [Paracoccus liaowanqingii]
MVARGSCCRMDRQEMSARAAVVSKILKHREALQPLLASVCDQARHRFGVPSAMVNLIDDHRQVTVAGSGHVLDVIPRQRSFCNTTIRSDMPLIVEDASEHAAFKDNPLVTGPPYIRFYAGVPLLFMREVRLGALCICDQKRRHFSRGDIAELEELADQVISGIAHAQFPSFLR